MARALDGRSASRKALQPVGKHGHELAALTHITTGTGEVDNRFIREHDLIQDTIAAGFMHSGRLAQVAYAAMGAVQGLLPSMPKFDLSDQSKRSKSGILPDMVLYFQSGDKMKGFTAEGFNRILLVDVKRTASSELYSADRDSGQVYCAAVQKRQRQVKLEYAINARQADEKHFSDRPDKPFADLLERLPTVMGAVAGRYGEFSSHLRDLCDFIAGAQAEVWSERTGLSDERTTLYHARRLRRLWASVAIEGNMRVRRSAAQALLVGGRTQGSLVSVNQSAVSLGIQAASGMSEFGDTSGPRRAVRALHLD